MKVLLDKNNGEIIQRGIEDFREVQEYMILAKEENATKTYAKLKDKYNRYKNYTHKMEAAFDDIELLKKVVSEHSQKLQNIS